MMFEAIWPVVPVRRMRVEDGARRRSRSNLAGEDIAYIADKDK